MNNQKLKGNNWNENIQMKVFIHELIIIGTSVGTLICRELIVCLKRFITTPKHVRANNKVTKHKKKLAKLTQKVAKENI